MSQRHLFTSESVSRGHPDKVADQISDAVLDRVLAADPLGRVACEVLVTGTDRGGVVVVAGEIAAAEHALPTHVEVADLARSTIADIGYDDDSLGFSLDAMRVDVLIHEQSPDIAQGVEEDADGEMGAGDQGLMFGYATSHTASLMPLPIVLAHGLVTRQAELVAGRRIEGLRPDAKSQVTVVYQGQVPERVDSVVLSTQHDPTWNDRQKELEKEVVEHILRPVLGDWWDDGIRVHVNPTGKFEIGGPSGDTGLTGRKVIVDTYGGWGRHGGGAFSGKDPTKVDRSGAYMARKIARHIVAAGLASDCEVRLSYAIGVPDPTAVSIDCGGTGIVPDATIEAAVRDLFPLTPTGIIEDLAMRHPIYLPTSYHGHFGRLPDEAGPGTFSWELNDRIAALRNATGPAPA